MNPKVDAFLEKEVRWQAELALIRDILLDCLLFEDYKWDGPCYTYKKVNIVSMRGFKKHFALWFFKGSLLSDPYEVLVRPGEETQANRQMRFSSMEQLEEAAHIIREYTLEAIEVEKAGLKVSFLREAPVELPPEFQARLDEMPELRKAFRALSPSRQRQYCYYFASARQEKTRLARIERFIPQILSGK